MLATGCNALGLPDASMATMLITTQGCCNLYKRIWVGKINQHHVLYMMGKRATHIK